MMDSIKPFEDCLGLGGLFLGVITVLTDALALLSVVTVGAINPEFISRDSFSRAICDLGNSEVYPNGALGSKRFSIIVLFLFLTCSAFGLLS